MKGGKQTQREGWRREDRVTRVNFWSEQAFLDIQISSRWILIWEYHKLFECTEYSNIRCSPSMYVFMYVCMWLLLCMYVCMYAYVFFFLHILLTFAFPLLPKSNVSTMFLLFFLLFFRQYPFLCLVLFLHFLLKWSGILLALGSCIVISNLCVYSVPLILVHILDSLSSVSIQINYF